MFDLFKRALVRYFGRPATSVSPQIQPDGLSRGGAGGPANQAVNPQLAELIERLTEFNAEARAHLDRQQGNARVLDGPHPWNEGRPMPVKLNAVPDDLSTAMSGIHDEVNRRISALDIPESATPEEAQRMIEAALADLPVRIGGVIKPGDPRYEEVTAQHEAQQAAEALAAQGNTDAPVERTEPDGMSWTQWQKWLTAIAPPAGWSPCRFGARWGEDSVGQMFGITRGDFGVYTRPFYVCHPIHGERVLAPLIHLPTGTGVGMFLSRENAVEAGELAMALGVDWRTVVDPTRPETWADVRMRLAAAWSAAGLHIAPFHAHDMNNEDDDEIAIWMATHQTRTAGKPAKGKLS